MSSLSVCLSLSDWSCLSVCLSLLIGPACLSAAGLGEFRIRDLNDEINKLLREKGHWEVRIKELGGPDYAVNKSVTLLEPVIVKSVCLSEVLMKCVCVSGSY